jgi:hypothetical protein
MPAPTGTGSGAGGPGEMPFTSSYFSGSTSSITCSSGPYTPGRKTIFSIVVISKSGSFFITSASH